MEALAKEVRHAYKKTRDVRSPMRCVPSSCASAWGATFGIRSRIVSVNGFAALCLQLNTLSYNNRIALDLAMRLQQRLCLHPASGVPDCRSHFWLASSQYLPWYRRAAC